LGKGNGCGKPGGRSNRERPVAVAGRRKGLRSHGRTIPEMAPEWISGGRNRAKPV